jgi:pyrroloquinoline quinone (PQQ) biosynthesis protein C
MPTPVTPEILISEFKAIPAAMGLPAIEHPWFQGLITGELSEEQILLGELQHTRRGWVLQDVVRDILDKAVEEGDEEVIEVARANYEEEAGGSKPHGDLMFQFHEAAGISREEVEAVELTEGTKACIAMLREGVQEFTALGSLAMMTLPEWQNATVSAAVYPALKANKAFSDYAIETYQVHAEADVEHGDRQLELLAHKVIEDPALLDSIASCLAYGVETFNYNWDGQYQAATLNPSFHWSGTSA